MSTTYNSEQGFTLIEIVVSMLILVLIASFAVVVSMDTYRASAFRGERDIVLSVLQKARSQSMGNICLNSAASPCLDGKPHGVRFTGTQYIIFQGSNFAGRDTAVDQTVSVASNMSFTPAPPFDIIFNQLDGGTTTAASIVLKDNAGHQANININTAGQIDTP